VAVTLIESRPSFLDFVDRALIEEFVHELRDRNVALRLGSAVTPIEIGESGRPTTYNIAGLDAWNRFARA
jgi:NAD(P) transhydrogenase